MSDSSFVTHLECSASGERHEPGGCTPLARGQAPARRWLRYASHVNRGWWSRGASVVLFNCASGSKYPLPDASLGRATPVLERLADKLFVVGPQPGQGAAMKIVNNLLAGANLAAASEAFALGRRVGLDSRTLVDVIGASSGQSWIFDDRFSRLLAGDHAPRAHAHILAKDVGLALAMARGASAATPVGDAAGAVFRAALAQGLADEDDSALVRLYLDDAPGQP